MNNLENKRKYTLYPVISQINGINEVDYVPAFKDIINRDDLIGTSAELEEIIYNMKTLSNKRKDDIILGIKAISFSVQNSMKEGFITEDLILQYERRLRTYYKKATKLTVDGEKIELGGIVGFIFNLIKRFYSKWK